MPTHLSPGIGRLPKRLHRLGSEAAAMEIVTTRTQMKTLRPEAGTIKRRTPRFDFVLHDAMARAWLIS